MLSPKLAAAVAMTAIALLALPAASATAPAQDPRPAFPLASGAIRRTPFTSRSVTAARPPAAMSSGPMKRPRRTPGRAEPTAWSGSSCSRTWSSSPGANGRGDLRAGPGRRPAGHDRRVARRRPGRQRLPDGQRRLQVAILDAHRVGPGAFGALEPGPPPSGLAAPFATHAACIGTPLQPKSLSKAQLVVVRWV